MPNPRLNLRANGGPSGHDLAARGTRYMVARPGSGAQPLSPVEPEQKASHPDRGLVPP
jgi:hypothetical protein